MQVEGKVYTNDPNDRGGETKYGISKRANPDVDVKNLTEDQAKKIYEERYWNKLDPKDRNYESFSRMVHQGESAYKATKGMDESQRRKYDIDKYLRIISKDPSQAKYINGWMNRAVGKDVFGNNKVNLKGKSVDEVRSIVEGQLGKPKPVLEYSKKPAMGTPGFSQTTEKQVADKKKTQDEKNIEEWGSLFSDPVSYLKEQARGVTNWFGRMAGDEEEQSLVDYKKPEEQFTYRPETDELEGPPRPAEDITPASEPDKVGPEAGQDDEDVGLDDGEDPSEEPTLEEQIANMRSQITGLQKDYSGNESKFVEDSKKMDSELAQELAKAQTAYELSRDATASKQMWEGIIQGIAHIAAGLIGKNTGLNLGGLKFDKQDWQAEKDRILRELQSTRDTAFRTMSAGQRKLAEQRMAAAQDYRVRSDILNTALNSLEKKEALEARKQKEINDRLRTEQRETEYLARQLKADQRNNYKTKLTNFMRSYNNFLKKDNESNREALESAALLANQAAEEYGVPKVAPEDLVADDPKAWLFKKPNKKLVSDRFDAFIKALGDQSGPTTLSDADRQALEWANANPSDPRSAEIKRRLGM